MAQGLALDEQLFAKAETTFGTAAHPVADDAFKHVSFSANALTNERKTSMSRKSTRGQAATDRISVRKPTGEFTLETEIRPYGVAGTAPDIDQLLTSIFSKSTTSAATVQATPAPTVTSATISPTGAVAIGDLVPIVDGNSKTRFVQILTNSSGAITWWPTLDAAPDAGAAVGASVNYTPKTNPASSVNSLTITRKTTNEMHVYVGCVVDSIQVSLTGEDVGKLTITGFYAAHAFAGTSSLTSGINDSVTTVPVADGTKYGVDTDDLAASSRILIGSEEMTVTAVSGNNLTVTRGVSPASHSLSDVVYPYAPSQTTAGVPLAGIIGAIALGDSYTYRVKEATFSTAENGVPRNSIYGTAGMTNIVYPARRAVACGFVFENDTNFATLLGKAKKFTTVAAMIQAGTAAANLFGIAVPRVENSIPSIDLADQEAAEHTIADSPALESSGNDEFRLAFA